MKKISCVFLLIFIVIISSLQLNAKVKNIPQEAILSFKELSFDFGKVKQAGKLVHFFKFKNTGNDNLTILSIQPSCGCTGATIGEKKEFAPGETGEIKITFDPQGREGKTTKTIIVTSNDKILPSQTLTFTCEILNN
ncbi:MAG: DUF1573 domain-containing protein [Bacteroidetes bacterium]|nr:DUF1573 domain-containing protein [Bacteroidota bacterium]